MDQRTNFTSESVCMGHPDKVCDQIADALLDHALSIDAYALADFDVALFPDHVVVMGKSSVEIPRVQTIIRQELAQIGLAQSNAGVDPSSCQIAVYVQKPSFDVSRSIHRSEKDDAGSSDGGLCIGYACDETPSLMPAPIDLAHRIAKKLDDYRIHSHGILKPDGKVQVCYGYTNGKPSHVQSIILCAQHTPDISTDEVRTMLENDVIRPVVPADQIDAGTQIYINPTGFFMTGGTRVKAGCTGRKSDVDFYGSASHEVGSSVIGKDPSKTSRSGSYMARFLAKNIVAAHIASACEVRMTYAIGLTDPVSIDIDMHKGHHAVDPLITKRIQHWIDTHIDLRPEKIIEMFHLRRPIYHALSRYGNVGLYAETMPWEKTSIAGQLAKDIGL